MKISGDSRLTHGLEQPDLVDGLLRLELEHPGVLDDVQDGGPLGSLAQHLDDQVLGRGRSLD